MVGIVHLVVFLPYHESCSSISNSVEGRPKKAFSCKSCCYNSRLDMLGKILRSAYLNMKPVQSLIILVLHDWVNFFYHCHESVAGLFTRWTVHERVSDVQLIAQTWFTTRTGFVFILPPLQVTKNIFASPYYKTKTLPVSFAIICSSTYSRHFWV